VDGYVYTQPFYVPHLTIHGKGVCDVAFVATEHDKLSRSSEPDHQCSGRFDELRLNRAGIGD